MTTSNNQNDATSSAYAKALVVRNDFELVELYSSKLIKAKQMRDDYRNKESAFYIIQKGMELGISPVLATEQINFIKGKCSTSVELMLALVYNSGLLEDIMHVTTGTPGTEDHKVACTVERKGIKSKIERSFSMGDAKRAGLFSNPNWKKYPQRMLEKRAYGWTLRDAFPDVIQGLFTNEEAEDIELREPAKKVKHYVAPVTAPNVDKAPIEVVKEDVKVKEVEAELPADLFKETVSAPSGRDVIYALLESEAKRLVDDYIEVLLTKHAVSEEMMLVSIMNNQEGFVQQYKRHTYPNSVLGGK